MPFGTRGPHVNRPEQPTKTPPTVKEKPEQKIKDVKVLGDLEWYHIAWGATIFTLFYQILMMWLWIAFPEWDWYFIRISLSLADAVGIFAIIISIWVYKKGKAEWQSEEGKSMKWITMKIGIRLKKAVDEGKLAEEEIDSAMDGIVDFIIKAKDQSKAYDKIKEVIDYAQKHKGDIENAIDFIKTIPKISSEHKEKIITIWAKTDIDKLLSGVEKGIDYLSNIKEVTNEDMKNAIKDVESVNIEKVNEEKYLKGP